MIPCSYAYIRQHCSYLFTEEKGQKKHHICLTHLLICVHHIRNTGKFLQLSDHFTLANFSFGVVDKRLPAGQGRLAALRLVNLVLISKMI